MRGRAFRLHSFHAARFRGDRRRASQRRKRCGDDQRHGPIHHLRVRGHQPRRDFIFRRTFPARHLRRSGRALHALHATASLALISHHASDRLHAAWRLKELVAPASRRPFFQSRHIAKTPARRRRYDNKTHGLKRVLLESHFNPAAEKRDPRQARLPKAAEDPGTIPTPAC